MYYIIVYLKTIGRVGKLNAEIIVFMGSMLSFYQYNNCTKYNAVDLETKCRLKVMSVMVQQHTKMIISYKIAPVFCLTTPWRQPCRLLIPFQHPCSLSLHTVIFNNGNKMWYQFSCLHTAVAALLEERSPWVKGQLVQRVTEFQKCCRRPPGCTSGGGFILWMETELRWVWLSPPSTGQH